MPDVFPTIGSLNRPRDNEPFAINRRLEVGAVAVFRFGNGAGATALDLAMRPSTTPADVKAALRGGRELGALPGDDRYDEGVLNVRDRP